MSCLPSVLHMNLVTPNLSSLLIRPIRSIPQELWNAALKLNAGGTFLFPSMLVMGNLPVISLLYFREWCSSVALYIFSCLLTCCSRNLGKKRLLCIFLPCCSTSWMFLSCTTAPLRSSGAQRLKAARCTDSLSIGVGFHRYPPRWIMQITNWRRCSSKNQRASFGMQATAKCWSLLLCLLAALSEVQFWYNLCMNIKQ